MKELPNAELEIMMIIWEYNRSVTRAEIDVKLNEMGRVLDRASVLTYLKRLEKRGFIQIEKQGKSNLFTAMITEEAYMQRESKRILKSMYHNSLKNFVCSLYDGDAIKEEDLKELKDYIDKKI